MGLTRREMLTACAALPVALRAANGDEPSRPDRPAMGIVEHAFSIRNADLRSRTGRGVRDDPIAFLEYCHERGAGGVQMAVGERWGDESGRIADKVESLGMYLEASIELPRTKAQLDVFDARRRVAARAGATILRTAILGGRRYETFSTADEFERFADQALRSLSMVKPLLNGSGVRLAVENHKDWRTDELARLLEQVDSEDIGVCLDTGNSVSLLEDPMEVVEALAPWAFTTHIKDVVVEEYEDGFLLAEVPLGEGMLDLPRVVRTLRAARPDIHLNLEMITRDPLKVPCLTPKYWATFDDLPGRELARALTMVRSHKPKASLQRISGLDREAKLNAEDENVRRSLAYAKEHLRA